MQVVAYVSDAVEIGVGMMAVGPLQASSSGHAAALLGGRALRDIAP